MLRIYKEGGGRGGLGLEVERWEGIVREVGYDPVGLKDMGDAEKKVRKFCTLRRAGRVELNPSLFLSLLWGLFL